MLELEAFCGNGTLIDAGKSFEQLATPLIDVFESDIAFERVDDCLHEVDTFLRIWQAGSEHLTLPDFSSPRLALQSRLADILLNRLQFLRCDSQPAFVDRAADVVNQSGVAPWTGNFEVDEVFGVLSVLRLEHNWEYGVIFELILNAAARDKQIEIGVVVVAWKSKLNSIKDQVQYFSANTVVKPDEADAQPGQFDYHFISIFYFLRLHLCTQFKFLQVVFKAQSQMELPNYRALFVVQWNFLAV